ncbi:hypothetical protein F5887DRAFT_967543 [Amanita rubescens]|nr:hypothetical protein F5887DRAFT_967543 [Amanita rubescens]
MSFGSWYASQFGTWNRTRRIRQTQFLARTNTNTSRVATAMAQHGEDAIVININSNSAFGGGSDGNTATNSTMSSTTRKTQEPLFGPNIGFVSTGPSWAVTNEKKVVTDDLTPDVVKGWIEKSKQSSLPTTTLQALVNLKRPTLRLSPLSSSEDPTSPTGAEDDRHAQHHGLEFEYDCDAPKCGIYVHVFVPRDHPDAANTASSSGYAKLLVFESVTEGGFGKVLKLEDGAMLELDRFELGRKRQPAAAAAPAEPQPQAMKEKSSDNISAAGASSGEITEILSPLPSSPEIGEVGRRRKFAPFHFRKKAPQGRSVAGPALAVVDMGQVEPAANGHEEGGVAGEQEQRQVGADGAAAADNTRAGRVKDKDEGNGVKVMIRLAALDEMGTELMSPNEQVTYLHVVRFGAKDLAVEEGSAEDTRPWVVKVVKREATIGPHTFHLHEIYGLTYSTSSHPTAPTAELPTQEHSYPPSTPLPDAPILTPSGIASGGEEYEPQSECLLCLSAPREVVLLPCRHLVACRECALNMVEFGAGGQITQPSDDSGPATTGGSGGDSVPATAGGSGAGTGATNTARRRRKAKGWYCPVCRQPYTSLLRITSHPPLPGEKDEHDHNDDDHDHDHSHSRGVNEVTNGVQEMDVSDQPRTDSNVVTESNIPSRSGSRRLIRAGRRPGADENV